MCRRKQALKNKDDQGTDEAQDIDDKTWARIKDKASLVEMRIAHEINLMGQRTTWLVTSQAFLFAAWVQLIKSLPLPQSTKVATTAGAGALLPSSLPLDVDLLLWVVPAVGMGISLAAWGAILAAMRIIDERVIDRGGIDPFLGITRAGPERKHGWTRILGHAPTEILPPLFVAAWAAVIWRQWHILQIQSDNISLLQNAVLAFGGWMFFRIIGTLRRHCSSIKEAAEKEDSVRESIARTRHEKSGSAALPQPSPATPSSSHSGNVK